MAHVITEPCIGSKDASCLTSCPVDCIHPTRNEPGFAAATMLYIDPGECICCGMCVDDCPVRAIFPEEDVPAEWTRYVRINLDYFKKQ